MEHLNNTVKKYSHHVEIENFTLKLNLKIGIYNYCGQDERPLKIYNKARLASEQCAYQNTNICFFGDELEDHKKEVYEISNSLLDSIKNKELYLVYQPKIDISDNSISGVEALIRWDRSNKKPVEPEVFIKTAEDIGFINEISKFVLDTLSDQIIKWQNKGIMISYSANITRKELSDNEFNKEVVAEGVETEEQYKILKELKCDYIQGFYFSEPLLANDFKKYYFEYS